MAAGADVHAIALAAGGARGAFQAGALLYMAEQHLRFDTVAGTSIGSVNGAFLAQGDGSAGHVQRLCAIWRALPDAGLLRPNPRAVRSAAGVLAGAATKGVAGLLAGLAAGRMALLDPAPLSRVLDRWLDYAAICRSRTRLVIALMPEVSPAYDILTAVWRVPTYAEARQLGARELRAALLAAVAIPLVFPSRTVMARRHADAGISDPVPARALYERGARRIVSILLSGLTPLNRGDFPGASLLQVCPSGPLGGTLASMLDFSRPTIERLIERGYADARAALGEARAVRQEMVDLRERGVANQELAASLPARRRRRRRRRV